MEDLILGLGGLAIAALSWGLKKLTDFIGAKTKNQTLAGLIMRLDDAAVRVVRSVYQAYVKPLKVSQDGKLSAQQKLIAKEKAIKEIQSYLGAKGLNELLRVFGSEDVVSTAIEAAVHNEKKSQKET